MKKEMSDAELQKRATDFFAMLASYGVTKAVAATPPPGAVGNTAEIKKDGAVIMQHESGQELELTITETETQ